MTTLENQVCWDIISCGLNSHSQSSSPCISLINGQYAPTVGQFQVPEPWNGKISDAKILFVSINPGFNKNELYPCTGCHYWYNNGSFCGSDVVEDFFENRFLNQNSANYSCQPYVTFSGNPYPHRFQTRLNKGGYASANGYWTYVSKIAHIIQPKIRLPYAITELVHCKSDSISSISMACLDRCFNYHWAKVISLASKVKYIVFVGSVVKSKICDFYKFVNPLYNVWYKTKAINGKDLRIVFVYHNNARRPFILTTPPPVSALKRLP